MISSAAFISPRAPQDFFISILISTINMSAFHPRLEVLTAPADIEAAGFLAADTMRHTPSYVEIYRGEEEWRVAQLRHLFPNFIRLKVVCGKDSVRLARDEGGAVVCSFMFAKSTDKKPSFWNKVQVGILEIPFRANLSSFKRLIQTDHWHTQHLMELVGDRPHYFVNMMVVAPAAQGKGVGTACLKQALKEADDENMPVILSTNSEINVRFYSKLYVL